MLHLFHLGPVVVGERRSWLLSGVTEEGGFTHPLVVSDLPSGLATLSARVRGRLRVEPELEAVGARFGIEAEPLPASARVPRAVLAFGLLTSFRLFRQPGVIAALLEACVELEKVRPWTRCRPDEPFGILMAERWRCWKREFVVLGSGGQQRGLELHERPGSVKRAQQAQRSLGLLGPPKLDSLLLTFGPGPAWAVEAVREAYGLTELPTVIRMKPGSRRAPQPLELLQLAAALRSAAILGAADSSPEYGAQVLLSADRYALEAVATPMPAAPVPRPVVSPAGEAPRNAPCPCGSGRKFKRCHLTQDVGDVAVGPSLPA
jgi:SEC-C motif